MPEISPHSPWQFLTNPFMNDRPQVITGRVSGRGREIRDIINGTIAGAQNAIILVGTPSIGKSTLMRYLQLSPSAQWSWRDELQSFNYPMFNRERLDAIRFVQVNLDALEDFTDNADLLRLFVEECTKALWQAYKPGENYPADLTLKGLYRLLRTLSEETSGTEARYFLILDNVERLGRIYMLSHNVNSLEKTPQEQGIALLDRSRAIRTVVDLLEDFRIFGFILSIESLPRASVVDQFRHISADLARFKTTTLQNFRLDDTVKFLAQPIANFVNEEIGIAYENDFPIEDSLFSKEEQSWLLELAGTHPYLLQRCCYNAFQFKIYIDGVLTEESQERQLASLIIEEVSTFLSRTWRRMQEALKRSANREEVEKQFYEFVSLCEQNKVEDLVDYALWYTWEPELRYILSSEGIVRADLMSSVHYPGAILRDYLLQRSWESEKLISSAYSVPMSFGSSERGYMLHIIRPDRQIGQVALSRLEYLLLKTLLQHAERCNEQELILGAWGEKDIDRATFTQRLHKLRKKLQIHLEGIDPIVNHYGGIYSLEHPEWFQLQ